MFITPTEIFNNFAYNSYESADPAGKLILSMFFDATVDVYYCEGKEKGASQDIKLTIIGKRPWIDYITNMFYDDNYRRIFIGRGFFFKLLREDKYFLSNSDILAVRINEIFGKFF
jgi:hypothetical protein